MQSMHKVLKRIIRSAGTPLAHRAAKLLRERDYGSLVRLEANPGDYRERSVYMTDAQIVATFRKLEGLPTGVDLKAEAVRSFSKCESQCAGTNARVAQYENWFRRGFCGDDRDLSLFEHLYKIKRLIGNVLGEIPQDLIPRLSGGSTYYDKGDEITIPHKMSSRPSVTPQAWSVIRDLFRNTKWDLCSSLDPIIVPGNRFTTVPKDSKKDRGICIEPSLNVAYQLAVGSHIRDRLKKVAGIDIKGTNDALKNAQTVHRMLAKQASVDGSLATIDLSNASDTVSLWVVKLLLPSGWFELLNALRSHKTLIGSSWIKLQKFSSMGNGFTFELETLLFWALAKSVSPNGTVSCYGDDIILPAVDAGSLVPLLSLLGFQVNKDKSFMCPHSPFRESCGGDFWEGESTRPVFFREIPSSPAMWMVLANQIRLIRHSGFNDREISKAWDICVNEIPERFRMYGPPWAGDGVLHTDDTSRYKIRKAALNFSFIDRHCHDDIGFYELRKLEAQHRRVTLSDFSPPVILASALLGAPSTGPIPRDGIKGYRLVWRPTVM